MEGVAGPSKLPMRKVKAAFLRENPPVGRRSSRWLFLGNPPAAGWTALSKDRLRWIMR